MVHDLVSVVIPTYNRAHTIARAVDSVLSQDYPAIEVIVVDDGSKDDTADRMKARYGRDSRVTYLRQPNGGVCVARNTGLARVRGEFVAMLDSDDLWLPGKLAMEVDVLRRHPDVGMVWTDMAAVDPEGKLLYPSFQHRMFDAPRFFGGLDALLPSEFTTPSGVRYRTGDVAHAMILGNLMLTSTVVARAERLAQAGKYDQSCHPCEDQDYYRRVCKTGPVAWMDTATVHYTIGAEDAESGPRRAVQLSTKYLKVVKAGIEK
jgi:glycosyltransferase involved in cell wall biosynthesis